MEQTDMTMTRTQYEHTCAVKAGIIHTDNLSLDNLACVTRAELARLNQLNWRNLRSPEARKALIAEAKLLTQAHRRARELGLNWGQRRRLIPQRTKIATPEPEATHA